MVIYMAPQGIRLRGISNTLAGLIIIAFLLTAVMPLVIRSVTSGSQVAVQLARSVSQQLAATTTKLNVTLSPNETTTTTKVYIVENLASSADDLYLVSVMDSSGAEYVVKVVDCIGSSCTAGSSTITVELLDKAVVSGNVIRLAPGGKVKIIVSNGKLLGVITANGGYAQAMGGVATVVQYAQYAAVAGAVQTQYLTLNNFTSLDDLFESGDVIIVDEPSDNTSDTSLLDKGAIRTYCAYDYGHSRRSGYYLRTKSGGFLRDFTDTIEAIYIRQMGPLAGSMVIGGRGGDYSEEAINVSIYMPMFTLSQFTDDGRDSDNPGIFLVKTSSYGPILCLSFMYYNYQPLAFCESFGTGPTVMQNLLDHLFSDDYSYSYYGRRGYGPYYAGDSDATGYYSPKLGLIAYSNDYAIYCPPNSFSLVETPQGYLNIIPTTGDCRLYVHDGRYIDVYRIDTSYTFRFTSYNNLTGLNDTIRGTVEFYFRVYLIAEYYYHLSTADDRFPQYPFVMKILNTMTEKSLLSVYDGYRDNHYSGTDAFGIYYYSGWYNAWYTIEEFIGEGGRLEMYFFHEGETSGLRPYMVLADTDANGMNEIVFMTEWAKPGSVYNDGDFYDASDVYLSGVTLPRHPQYGTAASGDAYGCMEESLTDFLYFKFTGPYVVNGAEIAEVSVQIRYSFHDAVGGDVDEVDDPKQGLWGFFVADENGSIVTSATYIYQQLQSLEDTWPPNMNFVSEAVFLPIPNKDEDYYILYGFTDPYYYIGERDGYKDDVEFTVVVEWIGMWYLHR